MRRFLILLLGCLSVADGSVFAQPIVTPVREVAFGPYEYETHPEDRSVRRNSDRVPS
jgi:hypothetical protein